MIVRGASKPVVTVTGTTCYPAGPPPATTASSAGACSANIYVCIFTRSHAREPTYARITRTRTLTITPVYTLPHLYTYTHTYTHTYTNPLTKFLHSLFMGRLGSRMALLNSPSPSQWLILVCTHVHARARARDIHHWNLRECVAQRAYDVTRGRARTHIRFTHMYTYALTPTPTCAHTQIHGD